MTRLSRSIHGDTIHGFIDSTIDAELLHNPALISNTSDVRMLEEIRRELSTCDSFVFSVAFISSRGLALLKKALVDFTGPGTIITSNYLDFNEPRVFEELLLLEGVEVFIHEDERRGFHAKGYIFQQPEGVTAIVGSSNLTDRALIVNQEWNIKFSALAGGDIAFQLADAVAAQKARSIALTPEWIDAYAARRQFRTIPAIVAPPLPTEAIYPNEMQSRALEAIAEVQSAGERRAVVISATGTGKTILAALAVRQASPRRMLFVVHREQILDKATKEFQRVLGADTIDYGKFAGTSKDRNRKYTFATIQSLTNGNTLEFFAKDHFDFIIIDEVHRSGSTTYKRLLDYFEPRFVLGLTATPERTDGFNVFELFDYNVPYEIRLHEALEQQMLVPFHYYGVTDYELDAQTTSSEVSQLKHLVSNERVDHVLNAMQIYGYPSGVRGLIFCSRKDEARELSRELNSRSLNGHILRTVALTGDDSISFREETVQRLEDGELDYIITVDVFNEGIDIPAINQVVMLRGTESSIIFTQQLGRGLRKAPLKDHLRVIDFIGNYANNYLIPVALFGNNSRDKDNIRRQLREVNSSNTLAGVSSVNFDKISERRILDSLANAKLTGAQVFKADITMMRNRLGKIPRLFDFARFDTVDPVVLSTRYSTSARNQNYWSLLAKLKFVETAPTDYEGRYLGFLSSELLSGKRPHELLLLQSLLSDGPSSRSQFVELLRAMGTSADDESISSVERILTYSFYTAAQQTKFGQEGIIEVERDEYRLTERFIELYSSGNETTDISFRTLVDDIVETGLFLSRERGFWHGSLVEGAMYSRREVCRLLNWQSNQESTVYGYKTDPATRTCPIFVTYHKSSDTEGSVNYGDAFVNPQELHWYSRNKRTLRSEELQPIIENHVDLHVLVKKDDAEGNDFYYLGSATASKAEQTFMPGKVGEPLNVVTMNLGLQSPIEQSLYDYLTDSGLNQD